MAIYAVHCPAGGDAATSLERARFLKLGFCWPALVLAPLWLLAHRLWRPLALWLAGAVLVGLAAAYGLLTADGALWLYLLSALYLGFEGRALLGAALARRGSPLADIVCAADLSTAELGYFARLPAEASPRAVSSANRPTPPAAPQILGLFPEAGR